MVSDIHGSSYYAKKMDEIFSLEKPDCLLVLGDLYYHGPRNALSEEYDPMKVTEVLNSYKDKIYVIRGNCDSLVDEMISEFQFYDDLVLEVGGKRLFCSHGHRYNIDSLPKQPFDMMAYGHFHTGFIKEKNSQIFMNPGSISLPKDGKHSYIVMDEKSIVLKDIDGSTISQFNW